MLGQRAYNPRIKPQFGAASVHPTLWNSATSIYLLNDRLIKGTDAKGVNHLTFGSTTAQPTWGQNNGGQGLTFDGGDDCNATITSVGSYPIWLAGSFTIGSVAGTQSVIALGSTAASLPAYCTVFVTTTTILFQTRSLDGSGGQSTTGPTGVLGGVYHFAGISRGDTNHTFFVNGQMYTGTQSAGASWSSLTKGAIGELVRNTTGSQMTGAVHWGAFGFRDPGDQFLRDLTIRPYDYLYGARNNVEGALFGAAAAAANEEHFLMSLGAGT